MENVIYFFAWAFPLVTGKLDYSSDWTIKETEIAN